MKVWKLGLSLAATTLALSACSDESAPIPEPTATTVSVDARTDFVGTWVLDGRESIVIRNDGTFVHRDCDTEGGTWTFQPSERTIALTYDMGTALGCASSDFQRATTGFLEADSLVLKNASVGDTKINEEFTLAKG